MSIKEDCGTIEMLDKTNYKTWKQDLYVLLKGNKLEQYILREVIKKISGEKLKNEQREKLTLVDGTTNTYYNENVTEDMIVEDAKTKRFIMNNIPKDLKMRMDCISLTSYEMFKLIESLNLKTRSERIEQLKEELLKMKYNPEIDDGISIFISEMNLKFKELEKLNVSLDYQDKFKYLYSSIPEDLAIKSNIISCLPNWDTTTNHLITVSQQLRNIQEIIIKKEEKISTALNVESKINSNYNYSNNNYSNKIRNNNNNNFNNKKNNYNNNKSKNYNNNNSNSKFYSNRNNIKCWNCGKFGHYSD